MTEVNIERTPKLGSLKETLGFVKDATKESASFQVSLMKESMKFFLGSVKKGMRAYKQVENSMQKGEGLLASPEIVYNGEKYWVLRYGPNALRTSPPKNFPTGYTVFTHENKIVYDNHLSLKICKLYRIWEEFHIRPFKGARGKKVVSWFSSITEKIFEEIAKRRHEGYENLDLEYDEKNALIELDDEVYSFHRTNLELTQLEEDLYDITFKVFEFPSEKNIENLISIVKRYSELLPVQNQYLERRTSAWTKYQFLLEKKYKFKVKFEFSSTDLGFAAFVDLMKYVLFGHTIPEGVLTGLAWDATKSIARTKITQASFNLLVHFGGLECLKKQSLALIPMQKGVENYLNLWKAEIPSSMLRLP